MAYTQAELDALKKAYASGVLEVSYDGNTIKYASAKDLLNRINTVERSLNQAPKNNHSFASFTRGY